VYTQRNQDDYMLFLGRTASGLGLLGALIAILLGFLQNFSGVAIFFLALLLFYIGMTSFWGMYNLNQWFKKYRSRLPEPLWQLARIPVIFLGFLLGILLYGIFHQFVLLLALDDGSGKPGVLASLILLLPFIGPRFANYIDYSPYGRQKRG